MFKLYALQNFLGKGIANGNLFCSQISRTLKIFGLCLEITTATKSKPWKICIRIIWCPKLSNMCLCWYISFTGVSPESISARHPVCFSYPLQEDSHIEVLILKVQINAVLISWCSITYYPAVTRIVNCIITLIYFTIPIQIFILNIPIKNAPKKFLTF